MPTITLTIGDKNLSSWSLRPWFLMTHAGIPFKEETIFLDLPTSRAELKEKSPSGLVPFLNDSDVSIWDSLAIAEYLYETFPDKHLWPQEPGARAFARAVSAEMHSGFSALRTVWPMMVLREDMAHTTSGGVQRDVDRILALWTECRTRFGKDGPFLFGKFSIADAMYAPVVSRLKTYGPVTMNDTCTAYMKTILNSPAMATWCEGAKQQVG